MIITFGLESIKDPISQKDNDIRKVLKKLKQQKEKKSDLEKKQSQLKGQNGIGLRNLNIFKKNLRIEWMSRERSY